MILFEGVSYHYQTGNQKWMALHPTDFHIAKGEWVTIIGANGSGKSTLARMMNGLVRPKSGRVLIDGVDVFANAGTLAIRDKVQMVFQHPDAQRIGDTPFDDVAFGLESRKLQREEMIQRVSWALDAAGLLDRLHDSIQTFSGGQKQRLAIAACLALKPSCLILDEPTSMLDPIGREEVRSIVRKLHKQGTTVIWVTQRLDELADASRVLSLSKGQLVFDGTPRSFFYETSLVEEWGWEPPTVVALSLALQKKDLLQEAQPLTEDELVVALCR